MSTPELPSGLASILQMFPQGTDLGTPFSEDTEEAPTENPSISDDSDLSHLKGMFGEPSPLPSSVSAPLPPSRRSFGVEILGNTKNLSGSSKEVLGRVQEMKASLENPNLTKAERKALLKSMLAEVRNHNVRRYKEDAGDAWKSLTKEGEGSVFPVSASNKKSLLALKSAFSIGMYMGSQMALRTNPGADCEGFAQTLKSGSADISNPVETLLDLVQQANSEHLGQMEDSLGDVAKEDIHALYSFLRSQE